MSDRNVRKRCFWEDRELAIMRSGYGRVTGQSVIVSQGMRGHSAKVGRTMVEREQRMLFAIKKARENVGKSWFNLLESVGSD